ncbi:iron uptake system protein EfeO [Dactylosporangium sp. NPDC006015]|uniref:iron uptake system protein EfeO n=1 Tax=Dactylosporangium sp. NPDC006015 TaxID=3154576 RepID=UPI0033A17336
MGTVFFASFLIGLRDGLEAALVVSILVAFLVQAGRRDRLPHVWAGVAVAILLSAGLGVLLTTVAGWLGSGVRMELFEAVTSLAAVVLVTAMIFWMRRTARTLKGELTDRLATALSVGGWAVAATAFFAVVREGVEMVLLVFAAAEGASESAAPLAGMLSGVVVAVGLGWLISTATARINLGRFFTWTAVLLILVAAGILKYAVHGLQSAAVLPGGTTLAFDVSAGVDPTSWYATLLAGTVNVTTRATVLEVLAWAGFAAVMLLLYFRPVAAPAKVRVGAVAVVAVVLTPSSSCGGPAAAPATDRITVTATDTTCTVSTEHTTAGGREFTVTNKGSKLTEFYVYGAGDRIIGEVENIAPGVTRTLHVELAAGSYTTSCRPGMTGTGLRGPLTVTGGAPSGATSADPALATAAAAYHRYLLAQGDLMTAQTAGFVAAVKAGDRGRAQALYAAARTPYERIEPVAESFGDLDPRIDARDGDLDPGQPWTGWHRIEQQLWNGTPMTEVTPVAVQLESDVTELRHRLDGVEATALEVANGAKSLLDEVAAKKVTGEEDRYSHTDLWDFAANVDGCRAALDTLRPVLDARRPDLGTALDQRFAAVTAELGKHRHGDGFASYDTLTREQVQLLAAVVNALAEQVSAVPVVITHP